MDVGTLKVALLGAGLLLANALLISGIVDQQAARRERLAREADERSLTQELDQIQLDLDDLERETASCDTRVRQLTARVEDLEAVGVSVAF